MSDKVQAAEELFSKGYNCAQAVIGTYASECGLDVVTALKIAGGFGGGMRHGEVCGDVTGALMVTGMNYGFYIEGDFAQKNICNQKTIELIRAFKEEHGSILCRDLLKTDIREPEDHTNPVVQQLHKKICPVLIATAVRILEEERRSEK